ncbi:cobalamin-dependent protein [Aquibium sp. A9E412]|uniref:B12-binding domain-containing radical SAM protein n=1 Tax=Aquibium sp. A9E412 TaxID=2976767 RepID=UPI0025B06FF2|nr:cobalamin-dependent protein [Aquibium sp. A9E412]MDN2567972.1 cobalamin-dependent protein [Aquibium sp. A9E412]
MNAAAHWLLVFPPLVHSNWGSYYPSTAVLAATLAEAAVTSRQLDLNAGLLDHLLAPERLAAIERGAWPQDAADAPGLPPLDELPRRSAAQLVAADPTGIVDRAGRHLPQEGNDAHALAVELSRPLHVDRPLDEIVGAGFAASAAARAYDGFFAASALPAALEATTDGVGISVPMGPQLAPAVLLARHVRARRPDLKIVVGGPTVTLMADAMLAHLLAQVPEIDAAVRYEGEEALLALASQCRRGDWAPQAVANVHTRHGPATPGRTRRRLRAGASARYDPAIMAGLVAPRLSVQQARGCYWGKCAYCDFVELFNTGLRYDGRRAAGVLDEVRHQIAETGVDRFWLVTEALPPTVGARFAEAVIEAGLAIDWRSFAMVDPGFTTETLRLLRRSGCSSLTVGLESMTSRALANVDKRADCADNLAFLEAVRAAGLVIDVNLIPDLPTTTAAEALEGLALLEPFADIFRAVAVFPFEATHSSAVGRDPARYGLVPLVAGEADDPLYPKGQAQFSSNRLGYRDAAMDGPERAAVMAAYGAFARRVNAAPARPVDAPPGGRRYRLRSPAIAAFGDGARALAYDWERDRAVELPAAAAGLLGWLKQRPQGATRGEIATFLQHSARVPTPHLPALGASLLGRMAQSRLVVPPDGAAVP